MTEAAGDGGERIRFCSQCGEPVSFSEARCPSCDHTDVIVTPEEPTPSGRVCRECEAPLALTLLFCPSCGKQQSRRLPAKGEADESSVEETVPLERWLLALAVLAPLLLLAILVQMWLAGRTI